MDFTGIKSIKDVDFKGKKVFLRAGYDVPLDKQGKIADDLRIKRSLPTIKEVFKKGAKQITIGAHLGRPQGRDSKLSLKPVAERLQQLTGRSVEFVDDYLDLREGLPSPDEASIILLENLRFHKEELANDEEFAKKLASFGDIYVNDAFSASHRAHASLHAICKFLPGSIGLEMLKEVEVFDLVLNNAEHPYIAILGGTKFETKLNVIQNLVEKVDKLLLGGAQIFTFYKSRGISVGKSLVDKKFTTMAQMLGHNEKIVLPNDLVIAEEPSSTSNIFNVTLDKIPSYMMGLDIGKETVEKYRNELMNAKTVVWNGPLGYYENPEFAKATVNLLKFLAANPQIKTIIAGGDTASAANKLGLTQRFFHVSTGGGASLKLLEGKDLIALDALKNWNN